MMAAPSTESAAPIPSQVPGIRLLALDNPEPEQAGCDIDAAIGGERPSGETGIGPRQLAAKIAYDNSAGRIQSADRPSRSQA
jgi:hypothetical protein